MVGSAGFHHRFRDLRFLSGLRAGKRHQIQPGMPSSEKLRKILESILSSVSDTMKAPVCITDVELDLRSQFLRTGEVGFSAQSIKTTHIIFGGQTAAGNWFADVLRHAYDDALYTKTGSGSDGVLICGGTLRGDSVYPPGKDVLG